MQHSKKYSLAGFTLVELIVVITIVALLSTIGFVVYSDYLKGARDGIRLHEISEIHNGMSLAATRSQLSFPDNSIEVFTGSTLIGYQGDISSDMLSRIKYEKSGVDPQTKKPYTMTLSPNRRYAQILGYLEESTESSSTLPNITTGEYVNKYPYVYGDEIGVYISSSSYAPAQEVYNTALDTLAEQANIIKLK